MPQKRARRRFTREYKAQAVQRVIESGRPLADIAAELDVSPGQLSQWRNEQLAAGSAEALAQKKADEAEMLRLRREVKRLEEENLILRKELDERCRTAGFRPEWGDVLRDLDRLQEVTITRDERAITLRTPATGVIGPLVKAAAHCTAAQRPRRQHSLTSPRTIPCDANNYVRRRKLLAYNELSKAGVQVQLGSALQLLDKAVQDH